MKYIFFRSNNTPPLQYSITPFFLITIVISLGLLLRPSIAADEEINWSMRDSRNMASPAINTPSDVGTNNIRWKLKIGTHQYSIPVIDYHRIYLGVNDSALRDDDKYKSTRGGMVLCLNKHTGEEIWKHVIPRFVTKGDPDEYHFNLFQCGTCSSPIINDKHIFVVAGDGSVLCLDKTDGDIIWRYDFLAELNIFPHDVCGSTILLNNGNLYVCTSNGTDFQHKKISNPTAPSLVVLNGKTGKLLAVANENISQETLHGQWSSPAFGRVKGKNLIFFGGGNGKCYAFDSLKGRSDKVQKLKQAWVTDCNPHDYRFNKDNTRAAYSSMQHRTTAGPSEIIGTAVLHNDRVYVAIGQSPNHGPGAGMLSCLDAETGKIVWRTDAVKRTTATAAIENGLLYISDYSKQLHCIDADTGKHYWSHDLESEVWCASPVVADGKVYIGTTRKDLWILKASKDKELFQKVRLSSMPISVVPENGRLYIPTQNALTVYESETNR